MDINSLRPLLTWLFSLENWQKRLILVSLDSILISLSVFLALAARLESHDFLIRTDAYFACAFALICSMFLFFMRGFYNASARHLMIDAALTIIIAAVSSSLLLLVLITFGFLQIPRSVPFIQAAFSVVSITSVRFFIRASGQNINNQFRKNIAIYGCGTAGKQLLEAMKWNNEYRVCQLIDDNPKLSGRSISGIKIERFDQAQKSFLKNEISTILIAMRSTPPGVQNRLFEILLDTPVTVKSIPSLTSLIDGTFKTAALHDVEIEDLLGRNSTHPDKTLLSASISGKSVLVTGAGGSIGGELCKQIISQEPSNLVLLDITEFSIYQIARELNSLRPNQRIIPIVGSVQNRTLVKNVLDQFKIDTVYHAAAYKHVPLMEQNVIECVQNNIFGTLNLIELSNTSHVSQFMLISSDKAVNPTNIMGATKRFAELICQDFAAQNEKRGNKTKFSIVRFGNVLGSSGSVIPLFRKQISQGGPITVTHEKVTRYFMTIQEAAQLVIQAASLSIGGDIFILDMGKPIKIKELAKKMITLSGKELIPTTQEKSHDNQIQILITGLRPGEKMHEELSYVQSFNKTQHKSIRTTSEEAVEHTTLAGLLNQMSLACNDYDHSKILSIFNEYFENTANDSTTVDLFHNSKS